MNTMHLKYAVEVEKTGSISQAAENFFTGQPNLSKAIKELEDTLGIVIFKRTSKGVKPTEQGREFLGYAKQILVQLEKMESIHISQQEREACQAFKVSIPRGSYISAAFANFVSGLDMDKGIDITIQETNSLQTIANVADHGFNLGIIRYQTLYENYFMDYLKNKSLDSEIIWEFSTLVLMSSKHPLGKCKKIDLDELKRISVEIIHGDNVVPYLPMAEFKQTSAENCGGKKVFVYERGSQLELLTRVKNSFMWVSPLPQELLVRYGLVQRRCHIKHNVFKDLLVYAPHYKFNATDKLFLNKLYEVKNEIAFIDYE